MRTTIVICTIINASEVDNGFLCFTDAFMRQALVEQQVPELGEAGA